MSTLNGNDDIGDLISDAMEDLPSPETSRKTEPSYGRERTARREEVTSVLATRYDRVRKSRNRKVMGEESRPKSSKSKTQIHVSSEKSVHMVFDSDSDSEDVPGGGVSGVSVHSLRGRLSGSEQGSIFSESDEDFCILDAPTSTRVVSPLCSGEEWWGEGKRRKRNEKGGRGGEREGGWSEERGKRVKGK